MSAQVTVHRMTTTTTTTAVLLNIGYLKTLPGIIKLFQIVLGIVAVAITGHYIKWDSSYYENMVPELFFLLVATTCLITTTLLLFSCLCSIATASIIPKTLFVSLMNGTLMYLLLYSSTYKLIKLTERNAGYSIPERGFGLRAFCGVSLLDSTKRLRKNVLAQKMERLGHMINGPRSIYGRGARPHYPPPLLCPPDWVETCEFVANSSQNRANIWKLESSRHSCG
ncbi:Marvel domain [Trinorchestia longiramus]|nr:Marvel domain [Trinorchestia longiramus]